MPTQRIRRDPENTCTARFLQAFLFAVELEVIALRRKSSQAHQAIEATNENGEYEPANMHIVGGQSLLFGSSY